MGKFAWSKYQLAIFNAVLNTFKNIAISATAGSGKSTVLVEISRLLPVSSQSIFLAFNKSIVNELKERLPKKFEVSTLHSIGLDIIRRNFGSGIKVNQGKVFFAAQKMISAKSEITNHKERNSRIFFAQKGYDFLRTTMTDGSDAEAVREMLLDFRIDSSYGVDDLMELVKILNKYNTTKKRGDVFELDFTDMIYLPTTLTRLKYPKYENVLVDEVQDLNKCQAKLINKIRARKSRLITVGDPYQSIYLFAGADTSSFYSFSDAPETISLPLSVTYRCPTEVVLEAAKFSPAIQASPNAEKGFVGQGYLDDVDEGDAVLCRNNSPLFEAYIQFLYEDKKAYIVGKDIQERFMGLIKPYKNSHISSLVDGLKTQLGIMEDALRAKGVKNPTQHPKYQQFLDVAKSLSIIAESCPNIKSLIKRIEEIFCPKKDAIVLSSIHKSKGLEYDRVFLLRPDLLPNKFAKSEEELQQERNLQFVAITRAKKEFYYVYKEDED
jgi:superfamily I DNA/RNA helicase